MSSRSGSFSFGDTSLARRTAQTCWSYQEDDERFNLGAGRTRDGKYHRGGVGQPHHERGAGAGGGRSRQADLRSSRRARTSTSIRSTIAMGCGLSAPTIADGISGW